MATLPARYIVSSISAESPLSSSHRLSEQQPILGSLTLGGYDSSRFVPSTASFPLSGNDSQSLMVGIQSITATETLASNVTLLSNDIVALIDTTLPYLYLPLQDCRIFETAFGLTWDQSTEMYLVNDTIHQQLQNLDPSVTFTLGNFSANESIEIILPYGAFDLQASAPIYPNGTNYFPLRRASDPHQYAIGRAFLQEAYLFVDFEQRNFSISQALFPENSSSKIITIDHSPPSSGSVPSPNVPSAPNAKHTLSPGAIAGIAVGSSVLATLICILVFFLLRRNHHRHHNEPPSYQRDDPLPHSDKESSPSSPEVSIPRHFSHDSGTTTTSTTHDTTQRSIRGELEDTQSPRSYGTARGTSPRQELAGCSAAKELPPIPPEKVRHISELRA